MLNLRLGLLMVNLLSFIRIYKISIKNLCRTIKFNNFKIKYMIRR